MKNKLTKLVDRIKNGKVELYRIDVMKGKHKIGIIVPAYNAESAINHVIQQGNYDIILEVRKGAK